MIVEAARLAGRNLFAPETRSAFWKILGITILLLIGLWTALRGLFVAYALPWLDQLVPGIPDWAGWLGVVFGVIASLGLAVGLALLIAPVTAVVAGFFLDGVAEIIEERDYSADPPGEAVPTGRAIVYTAKFLGVVIAGNIVAVLLLFVPGINIIAFLLVNGYLFGREFFEFAAMRFRSEEEVRQMRSKHSGTIFAAGLVIAAFLSIPLVNLLTPLFAAGLMVHLHKMLSAKDPEFALR
ncbi:sulfate transporter family protein [Hoeflea poritis]|uniref:Sulfate transporter family protein n=1 Tax=Hoeflea poritis TaxID=2993659 RepID=A0ABT4VKD4_9HYPH|nr:sulfate transporter family protein [Hoeflea poritis]MDA4845181.1 sulfate transporter family protein [Hoeflea poritis]